MTETFYYCRGEGQAEHYATRSEAEYTIEFLRDQDATYADLALEDIYEEVDVEDIDLDDPCLRNGSTHPDTIIAILRAALAAKAVRLDAVMTVQEIADEFGIHRQTVYDAIERGYIPARRSGATWLVRRADAEARWGERAAARKGGDDE